MTTEEINCAVAEACGWRDVVESIAPAEFGRSPHGWRRDADGNRMPEEQIPDYCHDRNATQSALATLSEAEKVVFGEWIAIKLGADDDCYEGWTGIGPTLFFELVNAPLELLCEGFLRAKELWKENT